MPGAPKTPPVRLNSLDFELVFGTALRQQQQPEHCCHLQLLNGPISVVPCRTKTLPLPHASILVRPHKNRATSWYIWWRRRALPPGPLCLFHNAFIAIAVNSIFTIDLISPDSKNNRLQSENSGGIKFAGRDKVENRNHILRQKDACLP